MSFPRPSAGVIQDTRRAHGLRNVSQLALHLEFRLMVDFLVERSVFGSVCSLALMFSLILDLIIDKKSS